MTTQARRSSKLPPMTDEEIRGLYRQGDPVSDIARKAYTRNGMLKSEVRRILFGEGAA